MNVFSAGLLFLFAYLPSANADIHSIQIAQTQKTDAAASGDVPAKDAAGKLLLAQLMPAGWVILVYEAPDGSFTPVRITDAVGSVSRVGKISESAVVWVYIDSDDSVVRPLQVESDGGLTPARIDPNGNPVLPKNLAQQNIVLAAQVSERGKLIPIVRSLGQGLVAVTVGTDSRLVRAGSVVGTEALAEADEETGPDVSIEVDNSGSGETGIYNVTGTVSYDGFAGTDHQLTLGATVSATEPGQYASVFSSYTMPVNGIVEDLPDSLSLSAYGYNIDYDNKLDSQPKPPRYAINGYGTAAKYTQFIDFFQTEDGVQVAQAVSYGISFDRYWTRDYGFDQNARTSIVRIPLSLSYNLWRNDETLGDTSLTLGYARNLPIGSAGDGADYEADRSHADPRYDKWTVQVYHGKQFASGWEAAVSANGQYAREPLVSAEGFALGGLYSVRGLEDSKTVGDSGASGQFEITTPNLLGGDTISGKLLAFADYGWTKLKQPAAGDPGSETAFSVGGGIKLAHGENAHLNLVVGRLSGGSAVQRYENEDGRIQLYFSAGVNF